MKPDNEKTILERHEKFIALIGLSLSLIVLACLLMQSAGATSGTFYYLNITPQNDVYELTVSPRDTILQQRAYDLSNVYGFSGTFAHWNDSTIEFTDCNPDITIDISYIKTNGAINPKNVYIDPTRWVRGNWYQWDGCFQRYKPGQTEPKWVPYENDNALMFKVIDYQRDLMNIERWQNRQISM